MAKTKKVKAKAKTKKAEAKAKKVVAKVEMIDVSEIEVSDIEFIYMKLETSMKELRLQLGMNQAEFWTQFGVTQSGGSRYESGRKIPKPVVGLIRTKYPNIV